MKSRCVFFFSALLLSVLFTSCRPQSSTRANGTIVTPPFSSSVFSTSAATSRPPFSTQAPPSTAAPSLTVPPTVTAPISATPTVTDPAPTTDFRTVFLNEGERQALDQLLASYPGQLSLGYLSLSNSESYGYRSDELYYAASLVKAPYALYLLHLADEGKCDLEQELTLWDKFKQTGTGTLKDEPEGTCYTVRELLSLMLTVSDNTAFKLLREEYPLWEYNRFCKNQWGVFNITYENITADDMIQCLAAIDAYIQTETENASFLKEQLSRSVSPFLKAPGADLLLHKHGWADPVFHDMAIVYQDNSYLLVLLSDHCDGTWEDVKMFSDISKTLKAFHDQTDRLPLEDQSSDPILFDNRKDES